LWMRVPYGEGVASHTGPEPCGGDRKVVVEALAGVRAGWVSSLENVFIRSADGLRPSEGNTGRVAIARPGRAPRGLRPQARTHAPHLGGGASRAKEFPFVTEAGRSRGRFGRWPEPAP